MEITGYAGPPAVANELAGADLPPTKTTDGGVSPEEWARFLEYNFGDEAAARKQLSTHLQWRAEKLAKWPSSERPQWVHIHGRARDGSLLMHAVGGKLDLTSGTYEEFTMDIAAIFDKALDRRGNEKLTIILDTRGGDGWPNPPGKSMVNFARLASNVLSTNFPMRVHQLIIYPLPWPFGTLYQNVIKPFMPTRVAEAVVILEGAGRGSDSARIEGSAQETLSCPKELGNYLTMDAIRPDMRSRHIGLPEK